jgi:two-component system, NtrC family, sensor kinase
MTRTVSVSQTGSSLKTPQIPVRQILLLDQSKLLTEHLRRLITSDPILKDYHFVQISQSDDLIQLLVSGGVAILIVVDYLPEKVLPLLELAKQVSPSTVRVIFSQKWEANSLTVAANSGRAFRILKLDAEDFEIRSHLLAAEEEAGHLRARSDLKKILAEQNKNLEQLNKDLEKMVEDKTADIRRSKDEIDEKVLKTRQLINFIKDLSANVSFAELMSQMRREVHKFAKVGDPVLILQSTVEQVEILYFLGGNLHRVNSESSLKFSDRSSTHDKQIASLFVGIFKRPVIKVISIPLQVDQIKKFGNDNAAAVLCIEHSMNELELETFLEHLRERMQPIAMAVDRAFLQNELTSQYYRWEKTFDGLKDPIAIIDVDYRLIRSNKKFSDKIVPKHCYEEFAQRTAPCEGCPISQAIQGHQPRQGQVKINGRVYTVNSFPIVEMGMNKPTTVINQYIDVTESRALYVRMLQNEKMSAIGLLAGNIAHELNNPLTGIRSLAQVLVHQSNEEQLKKDLLEIEKAAGRSQKIISNLLEFSSGLNTGADEISLDETVEKTLPMLKSAFRSLKIIKFLSTNQWRVRAESHLLQQVVFNLINNACQAMPEAGTLTLQSRRAEDNFLELIVKDTGPGIPLDLHEKVFEPFFTTKSEGQGTGLGLSLSREIIRRSGGDILLKSVPGQGAEFIVRLPASGATP